MSDEVNEPVWIRIGIVGVFGGVRFDRSMFEQIVANFRDPVPWESSFDRGMAIGWVEKVEVRGEELWGLVRWIDKLKADWRYKLVQDGSAAVALGTRDAVTGNELGPILVSVIAVIR